MIEGPISVRAQPSMAPPPSLGPPRSSGDPCTMVLFGATGDLARRKLIASIYDLAKGGLLSNNFRLLGVDREPHDDTSFRSLMRNALDQSDEIQGVDEQVWSALRQSIFYMSGDLTTPTIYGSIKERLCGMEGASGTIPANRLFYLAVPPFLFEAIVTHIAASGLACKSMSPQVRPWHRFVIEKPFGHSLRTAIALNQLILSSFSEHQIYRIDHYLGKETVQNILVFRSANAIFEPIWNRNHISHVQITAAETVGVEARGAYYEHAGVIRDMFQNHLLQLLALTAMELPTTMSANAVRDEKVKALRAVRPLVASGESSAVRAQYSAGTLKGARVPGYRKEPNVSPTSTTPTYAALRLLIDNGRWRGVPFYLRSGKRMANRGSEIAVSFRVPPYLMEGFAGLPPVSTITPNVLVLRVQPNDGITLRFEAKVPGAVFALTSSVEVTSVDMDFTYKDAFGATLSPAYETLLLDCMIGDATLFTRSDEVEAGWRLTDPLLESWEHNPPAAIDTYEAGTWGPAAAEELIAKDGFRWREP